MLAIVAFLVTAAAIPGCAHRGPPFARIIHVTAWRDREDGRATGHSQGLAPESYLNSTSQGSRPEDGRKDGHTHGRSRRCMNNAGK